MIICLDSSGLVEITNPVTERILQVSLNELNGHRLIDVCPFMEKFSDGIELGIGKQVIEISCG